MISNCTTPTSKRACGDSSIADSSRTNGGSDVISDNNPQREAIRKVSTRLKSFLFLRLKQGRGEENESSPRINRGGDQGEISETDNKLDIRWQSTQQ